MTGLSSYKPFIIPVFIPHNGCPHQCVFCNQHTITGVNGARIDPDAIRLLIDTYLGYNHGQREHIQISYYGGTFLGLDPHHILQLLALATSYVDRGLVDSIRCSTRPDTISEKTLALVRNFPLKTVELGVQSMDNHVLACSNRGHTAQDTETAVTLLKSRGYQVGLQMMVGLPGDNGHQAYQTALRLADLKPDFIRIYPTLVMENSPLAQSFKHGEYRPLDLATSVTQVKTLFLLFRKKRIPVIRMGLQASEGLDRGPGIVDGPYHPSFGHMVYSEIFLDMARCLLKQQIPHEKPSTVFFVHPKNISNFRGLKNHNVDVLKAEFGYVDIRVKTDITLGTDTLRSEQTTITMDCLMNEQP